MGKRKERRLAAKIGAGRRVKLDLFAEPSGDLGGSSAKDEDGKDVDSKLDQELPNSPSSSGQPPENPLSLLGQYSDDELDDGSNEAATSLDDDKQGETSAHEPVEEGEIVDVEDHSSQKAHSPDVEKDSASASASLTAEADAGRSSMSLDEKDHDVKIEKQDHVFVANDTKTTECASWKMVLHEESNRYYYWNTVTGETSWGVPDSLAQEAALTNELETLEKEMRVTAGGDVNAPTAFGVNLDDFSASQGVGYTSEISDMKVVYEPGVLMNQSVEQSGADGSQFLGGFSVVGAHPYAASYEVFDQSALSREHGTVDLPSGIVRNGEALLEKLKLLQGSVVDSVEHSRLFKYMVEIEIRLSDIRCLLPYGLSLVPFWMHSEAQFNRLENAINTEFSNQNYKASLLHLSTEGKETHLDEGEAKVRPSMSQLSPEAVHDVDTPATVQKAVHGEASDDGISNVQQTSLQDSPVHLHSGNNEIDEAAAHEKASSNSDFQSTEDVDMDIDMEVEDQSPARRRIVDIGGQLVQASAPMAGISLTPESDFIIPPPPQEEWFPPPPPEEEIPPPPPDEPPESLCPPPPPSETEPVPSIYIEQHTSTYIEPNVNYYGNTITESLGTSFHEQADVNQLAALTPSAYYIAVSNAQPTSVVNPVDSAAYYGIPNGALPVVSVPATVGLSKFQASDGHQNYDPLSTEQAGVADPVAKASSLSKQFLDPLSPFVKSDIAPTQVSSTLAASASATVSSTKEYASVPSYSASATSATSAMIAATSVTVSDAAAVSKVQSKASRMKKPKVAVASSLRSNKKVSSLVDKWKAAKEELEEEEEEERETHLEILEKKRQREIEGWRAQQIASGEAKENANFQPLGGDWRERVKRRRAQKEAAAGTTSDAADNGNKQPDLSKLSRDLPPGWQAYWDDSSRQVYYANSVTSETTWTKPTR
ncbi:hypothetical protein BVRB_4g090730 isoform A [Beta vulgaris subsp. vulgaris]|uniref:uncharacterized protein LOC104891888 isoform X1 n=1 Tax=Beta vulgaris subsp. vulgaris TaxID=3555 RepID=UPI00065C3A93|nr:uncharacterized protein LOC104891888 isoform X1 [Beta vulgaris subsp. vulgaris]KMT12996.1 hypothetical protein BVRB_4g090730 isoform A [Beta vulgaris subsp. vulgaris]